MRSSGNALVVVLSSFALALQVELRAIHVVAAPGGSPVYGGSRSGSGADSYQGSAGLYRGSGGAPSTDYNAKSYYGGYSPSSGQNDDQKETKYYYGGKYQGSCVADGLYYRDDTTFIICSNGYPHEQPCPPGTKTSGSPRYQPGYYYGYTDLCSVNLVDYGYGPEYYAPRGYPELTGAGRELAQGAYERGAGASGGYNGGFGRVSGSNSGPSAAVAAGGRSSTAYDRNKPFAVREEYGADRVYTGSAAGSHSATPYKARQFDLGGSPVRKDVIQGTAGSGSDQSPFRHSTSFASTSGSSHYKPSASGPASAGGPLYHRDPEPNISGSAYLSKHQQVLHGRPDAEYSLPSKPSAYHDSKFI